VAESEDPGRIPGARLAGGNPRHSRVRAAGQTLFRERTTETTEEAEMNQYVVVYTVVGAGVGNVEETVGAASEYNARRMIEAKYRGQQVRISDVKTVR
jgi:hypothetical protein